MGGVARLARDLGHQVSGSDANTYPPMSTQLESLGIDLFEGYDSDNLNLDADVVLIGNSISRGNPELELALERGLRYTSGAQWLSENVLQGRWVLAVAGTHGKTTTASILAWLLEDNQLAPGFLIGGVPENFGETARIGDTPFFVIEADEYDTAFCDKRSKFVHYRPRTLIINNLEFDHADIFADLAAIQTQFHHLLKTVPQQGKIIHNQQSEAINQVFERGVWSETADFGGSESQWRADKTSRDASRFDVLYDGKRVPVSWSLIGEHNMYNALAAIAAAHHVGIGIEHSAKSLQQFKSVKRRLEKIYEQNGIRVYDDFAHHPTAINETLQALRNQVGEESIIAILEPRSNTMKQGVHKHLLAQALQSANNVMIFADDKVSWDISELENDKISAFESTEDLLERLLQYLIDLAANSLSGSHSAKVKPSINILIMSNGGFEGLHKRLIDKLCVLQYAD